MGPPGLRVGVVGGGIGGLALALALRQRGVDCEVFESAAEVREIGVGITLLPHAMRELSLLGLGPEVERLGIANEESVFFNRHGQFIYREPRGRYGGYDHPEVGIHRGRLHGVMYRAALASLGAQALHLGSRCVGLEQDEAGATLALADSASGVALPSRRFDAVVACDGVNSALRRIHYPEEKLAFTGINLWRGVTRHKPILTGRSYLRIGSIDTGKMVIYPIADEPDSDGCQLINWVAELRRADATMNDWNQGGRITDFIDVFEGWRFDWLDVPALIRNAQKVLEYPMVDKDPVERWTFGRLTLLGDAAHPMYPRGSNGSAQALIDARVLAEQIAAAAGAGADVRDALSAYEALRRPATARVVQTNRSTPPDFIIMKADELSGGKPFRHIDDLISQDELRRISEHYKRIAGFSLDAMKPV